MQWLSYNKATKRKEEKGGETHTLEKTWQLKDSGSLEALRQEWTHDTYHIWQGYAVLGNYQSDVKGGFNRRLVPAGESSASIRGLEGGRERQDTNWDCVCSNPDEFRLCSGPGWGGLQPEMHPKNESPPAVIEVQKNIGVYLHSSSDYTEKR